MAENNVDYQFKFEDGSEKTFQLKIDPVSLQNTSEMTGNLPEWTKLDFNKCSHCPYSSKDLPHCPVAVSISRVAEAFKSEKSFTKTTVFVRTGDRIYGKQTDMQTGLQSLFGLVMATSQCSHMDFFKPMALHHLPFSSYQETIVRVLGQYLIQQYLKKKAGKEADWDLVGMVAAYGNISTVNQGIIGRIRAISKGDADRNAIIILDNFASLLPMELDSGFDSLDPIFRKDI